MSKLDDRTERQHQLQIRDTCIRNAVQLAGQLDSAPDAQTYNKYVNTISALSLLASAISDRYRV